MTGFQPISVPEQAASALRDAIRQGILPDALPGELQLARQLNVSRPSIRAALAILAQERLITIRHGRRSRLNRTVAGLPQTPRPAVCVVSPISHEALSTLNRPLLADIRAKLAARGIGWDEFVDVKLGGLHPDRRLRERVVGRRNVCWLLVGSSAAMQRWFHRTKVKALVLGSCHPGISLPSIDVNHHAMGWHAAGRIVQHGHHRVLLVLPATPRAGDVAFKDGVMEYLARHNLRAQVSHATERVAAFGSQLSQLLVMRPTVILTTHAEITLRVLVALLRRGMRIPRDISIISRETHPMLMAVLPDVAHYSGADGQLTRRTVRGIEALLAGWRLPPKNRMVIPKYVGGSSLGRPPS